LGAADQDRCANLNTSDHAIDFFKTCRKIKSIEDLIPMIAVDDSRGGIPIGWLT